MSEWLLKHIQGQKCEETFKTNQNGAKSPKTSVVDCLSCWTSFGAKNAKDGSYCWTESLDLGKEVPESGCSKDW